MVSITAPEAILGAGALSAGTGLVSGIAGAGAATSAANTQAQAAQDAAQATMNMFNTTQANLQPYMGLGTAALPSLEYGLGIGGSPGSGLTGTSGGLTAPFQPTQAQLAQTPGYQFTLNQGLQATQNSYAAQGLGSSGAALKGAANYAEGLASTTYQQQFQNNLATQQNAYNMLSGAAGSGQNAAANLGGLGLNAQGQANALNTSAAAAQAAGTVGSTNALTGALGSISGAGTNTALLTLLNNAGLFGGGTGGIDTTSTF